MKKLYIHIGSTKAGSTSIQAFLTNNQKLLLRQGILYPANEAVFWRRSQINLAQYYAPIEWFPSQGISVEEAHHSLREEIEQTDAQTVIISAETLFFCETKNIERIKNDFDDFDVYIVAFLRRQDKWIESWQNQLRKRLRVKGDSQKFLEENLKNCDYFEILSKWEKFFGREKIVVVPFEKQQLRGGLLNVFSKDIGFKIDDNFHLDEAPRNMSWNRHALSYISKLPVPPKFARGLISIHVLEKYSLTNPDKKEHIYTYSPAERLNIIDNFELSNKRVAQRYLNRKDGVLFYEDLPSLDDPWEPYKGIPLIEALKITTIILAHHLKVLMLFFTNKKKRRDYINRIKYIVCLEK